MGLLVKLDRNEAVSCSKTWTLTLRLSGAIQAGLGQKGKIDRRARCEVAGVFRAAYAGSTQGYCVEKGRL